MNLSMLPWKDFCSSLSSEDAELQIQCLIFSVLRHQNSREVQISEGAIENEQRHLGTKRKYVYLLRSSAGYILIGSDDIKREAIIPDFIYFKEECSIRT